jgi:hypothetical protein
MTMRLTQLPMHWEADEALAMIQLLDQFKDLLWSAYGEEIIRQEYAEQKHRNLDAEQLALELEDPILF